MAKDSAGSAGGVGPSDPTYNYIDYERVPWAYTTLGLDATSGEGGDFTKYSGLATNHLEALIAAQSAVGGCPYDGVAHYDPDTDNSRVILSGEDAETLVDTLSPSADLSAAVVAAAAVYDASITSSTQITNMVTAIENRQKGSFLREMSRVEMGMFDGWATMNTQFGFARTAMEVERGATLADISAKAELYRVRERSDAVLKLADAYLSRINQKIQFKASLSELWNNIARTIITSKQDQISFDSEMEAKCALWDLELFPYFNNALGALKGGVTPPRAQTPRERLLAAVQTSASTGFQFGAATGRPGLGLLAGALDLVGQLWAAG